MATGDTNFIFDGNTQVLGRFVDNIIHFLASVFGGLSSFGNIIGILLGVTFVLGLILIVVGKIKISDILGSFR